MNLCVCVLLLSLWTCSGLHTNKSDGPPPNEINHLHSMEINLENFRRRLLIVMIGGMIIAFICGCCQCPHYICLSNEAGMVRGDNVPARSSKLSFGESKTDNLHAVEEQVMHLDINMLPGHSGLGKSSRPSSTGNLNKPLSPVMSSIGSHSEKLTRPSIPEKISKLSSPKILFSSPHLEMSCVTCSLDILHELDGSYNLLSQGILSYPNIINKFTSPAYLQHPVTTTKSPALPYPQNRRLLCKSSGLPKCTKSSTHSNVKESVSASMGNMLSRPQLIKPYQCHQEKLLASAITSQSLSKNISEPKKTNAQTQASPCEAKPFSKWCIHEVVYGEHGNGAESHKMINENDDGSDGETTIIFNVYLHELIPKGSPCN